MSETHVEGPGPEDRLRRARRAYLLRTAVRSVAQLPRDLAFRAALAGRGLGPLPPPHLRHRVIGDYRADRFHEAGLLALRDLERALLAEGRAWTDLGDVLDFGVGCGKLLRWLRTAAPHLRVRGTDIDSWAVSWLRGAYDGVDVRRNEEWPPLDYPDASFDLVVAISVFTHLDGPHQLAWLRELRRVLRSGGILLATYEGRSKWAGFFATAPEHPGMREYRRRYESEGFLFVTNDGWAGVFPDFYHSTFQTPEFVRERWGQELEVRAVIPDGLRGNWGNQDLVVLRNPGEDRASGAA